jgi:hypothetical protein
MKTLTVLTVLLIALILMPVVSYAQDECDQRACVTQPQVTSRSVQGAQVEVFYGDPDDSQPLLISGPNVTVGDPNEFEGPIIIKR